MKFDAQGNAKLVWNEARWPEQLYSVRVKEYTKSAGWSGPLHLILQDNIFEMYDNMDVAGNGATVVAGRKSASGGYNIWANVMAQP